MGKYGRPFGVYTGPQLAKTKMTQPNTHSTTFNFGYVIPIGIRKVVPGDVISSRVSGLIRMSTPSAPIMTGIHASLHCFFVPRRLVWEHEKEFYGENKTTAGPQPITYTLPHTVLNSSAPQFQVTAGSVAHYLGYPLLKASSGQRSDRTANVLPMRAYYTVINEYYRKQQIMDPYLVNISDSGGVIYTRGGSPYMIGSAQLAPSLKNYDMYTTCTIAPVQGGDTILPLGSYAPVVAWKDLAGHENDDQSDGYHDITNPGFTNKSELASGSPYGRNLAYRYLGDQNASTSLWETTVPGVTDYSNKVDITNLYADLRNATASSIADLYLAMAVEKWKYHANFGTRYFERLQVSFGVVNPDLIMERPEHLGEYHFDINVQTVLATAETSGANLGQPGANSTTGFRCNLFNHSFGEPGYVLYMLSTYMDQIYTGGLSRMFLDEDVLDEYWPEFVNKADDAIRADEVFFDETVDAKDDIFGFNEAWANERWTRSRASGLLDPYVTSGVNSTQPRLPGFILGKKWGSAPSLNEAFLIEDRSALTDALVTGANGPDFVADFFFDDVITRAITPKSRPGIPTDLR